MSDDLVKRLREHAHWGITVEAANRIDELEAKMNKAVESLIVIDSINPAGLIEGCSQSALTSLVLRMGEIARNTLEAVEGDAE
jgi:hypothetical protein